MLAQFLDAARRREIVGKVRDFMRHDLRFGGVGAGALLGVLRLTNRLSLGARIVEGLRLRRKLMIILAMPTAAIPSHQRALPNFMLRFRRQGLVHFRAVIVPVRALELAGLADIDDERTVEHQRLVFFAINIAIGGLQVPLLYLYLSSVHLSMSLLHAQLMLFSAAFFSSSMLLICVAMPPVGMSVSVTDIYALDSRALTAYWHARLVQLLRYAAGRARAERLRWQEHRHVDRWPQQIHLILLCFVESRGHRLL